MGTFISVCNWEEMQHYKDRSPPWIKMHSEMLESYEFECLPDASKAHLLCIMLLASRTNNKIQADQNWIKRKIGANNNIDLELLLNSGFIQSNQPLTEVGQDASSVLQEKSLPKKRERESRGRVEGEGEKTSAPALDFSQLGFSINQIDDLKRIRKANKGTKLTQRIVNALAVEFHNGASKGYSFDELLTEWEVRGWKSFKAEWIDTKQSNDAPQGLSKLGQKSWNNIKDVKLTV